MADIQPTIEQDLNAIGQIMVMEAKKGLIQAKRVASKTLINSVDYTVKKGDDGNWVFSLVINEPADRYAQYTEIGRPPGKQPPLDAIKRWTQYKGIDVKWAYPIARKIGQVGYKGKPVFGPLLSRFEPIMSKSLEEDIAKEIERFIAESL